ncbi:MAG: class I SAM-dependent methyltransferase [Actinobacteria bacterium]|nr:class I SAM-dependent methyltransferase [Actinomycetota bacterium]
MLTRLGRRRGDVAFGAGDRSTVAAQNPFFRWLVEWLDEELDGTRMLDAGCWNAPLGIYLCGREAHVTYVGVDLSAEALRAVRRHDRDLRLARVDLARGIPFAAASFDGVALIQTYEHLPRRTEDLAVRALARLVRPGGWFVLSTELNGPMNFLDPAWYFGHRHYWPRDVARVLEAAGLVIERQQVNGGPWQYLDMNAMYVVKHLLRRAYRTPAWLRARAEQEYEGVPRWLATRMFLKCRRPASARST